MSGSPDVIVVGAGPAGLACAATMTASGLKVAVLEKANDVGGLLASPLRSFPSPYRSQPFRPARFGEATQLCALSVSGNRSWIISKAMPSISAFSRFSLWPPPHCGTSKGNGVPFWRAVTAPVAVVVTGIAGAPYRRTTVRDRHRSAANCKSCQYLSGAIAYHE